MFDLNSKKVPSISKLEKQVLKLIARGMTCEEIGFKLGIASTTVISHRNSLKRKSGAKNSCALVYYAVKHKLI